MAQRKKLEANVKKKREGGRKIRNIPDLGPRSDSIRDKSRTVLYSPSYKSKNLTFILSMRARQYRTRQYRNQQDRIGTNRVQSKMSCRKKKRIQNVFLASSHCAKEKRIKLKL